MPSRPNGYHDATWTSKHSRYDIVPTDWQRKGNLNDVQAWAKRGGGRRGHTILPFTENMAILDFFAIFSWIFYIFRPPLGPL